MFKSSLQEYAQKCALPPPVYGCVREGPPHAPHFTATVTINGLLHDSGPGFSTLKAAEKAAAKVALEAVLQSGRDDSEAALAPVQESGLCKNLLQEYAQKSGLPLPVYRSNGSGNSSSSSFTSTVEMAGVRYTGAGARTKKEAEISAARTALLALQSGPAACLKATESGPANPGLSTPSRPARGIKRSRHGASDNERRRKRFNRPVAHAHALASELGYEPSSQESCLSQVEWAPLLPVRQGGEFRYRPTMADCEYDFRGLFQLS